jgi:phosphatidylglycerophosphate synthase
VTLAVLFPPSHPAIPHYPAEEDHRVVRLRDQLLRAGAREVRVVTGAAGSAGQAELAGLAERAATAGEPLLLCTADLVAHPAVLRHLATSPAPGTVALTLRDRPGPGQAVLTEERGQVVAARFPTGDESAPGAAADSAGLADGATFGGAIRVAAADLPALAAAARGGIPVPRVGGAARAVSGRVGAAAPDRLLVALAAAGVTLFAQRVRLLVAHRPTDPAGVAAAEAEIASVDEDTAQLRLSVKERDDLFTTYCVSTWSPWVTRLAARLGFTPTGVTAISVLMAVAAALLFAFGGRAALVLGAVLLYLGFVFDCVDGQLARYTRRFSPWGGWLDTMADRAKEYVVYAGLAVGVDRAGLGNGWTLAIAALVLQTARHMTDTWYGALHDEAARRRRAGTTGEAAADGVGDRLSRVSVRAQADVGSPIYWVKRTMAFPIGERWALIAITAGLFDQWVSLVMVLAWGALAAVYTLLLRTLRARSMRVAVLDGVDTALHRDDGPLARLLGASGRHPSGLPGPLPFALLAAGAAGALLAAALAGVAGTGLRWSVLAAVVVLLLAAVPAGASHAGPLDWLVPAALRTAEYLFVIAVDVAAGVPGPVTFALLFALALRHYDLTARLEKRESAPRLRAFGLGWDGRLVLLGLAVTVGAATAGAALLAAYLFVILVVSAGVGWSAAAAGSRGIRGGEDEASALAMAGSAEERNR